MATGGTPTRVFEEEKRESMTCSLCLNVFNSPKILPCAHSFCLKCLQDLITHRGSPSFPCPHCRQNTTVPPGGAAAFQNNFYLHAEDLDRARDGTLCLTHPKQDLDLYCVDCQQTVCLKCVLTKHKLHTTKDLCEAANESRAQLQKDLTRLHEAVFYMAEEVSAEKKEQQAVHDKKATVENAIRRKHATLVAMADKFRDDSLASLDTLSQEINGEVSKDLDCKQSNLGELRQLQQRLQEALSSGSGTQLLAAAKEMREGWGSLSAVNELKLPKRDSVSRPLLNSKITPIGCMNNVRDFFGSVERTTVNVTKPYVKVEEKFSCGNGEDTEVFSLCVEKAIVLISYAYQNKDDNAPCNRVSKDATNKITLEESHGKRSWKVSRTKDAAYHIGCLDNKWMNTFSKSVEDTFFKVINPLSGLAEIKKKTNVGLEHVEQTETTEFSILVGAHRAFDVDSSEQLFVVVEEAQTTDGQRKVHLYRRGQKAAVATYSPPTPKSQPSDVCFYKLSGREVLVVSDEGTDSLHVVNVHDSTMNFEHYLAPGCPLLVQPTALNTDSEGDLWVACRGGAILAVTPVS